MEKLIKQLTAIVETTQKAIEDLEKLKKPEPTLDYVKDFRALRNATDSEICKRCEGEYKGKGLYLYSTRKWEIVTDEFGVQVLLCYKK